MKIGKILCLWMVVLVSFPALAQRASVEIKGTVVEEGTSTPVEQATVRLLNVRDSTMINGVASSRNGTFSLKNVKPGDYLLHISFIGFEPLYQPLQITGRTASVDVGKLELSDGSILLGEAVVIGKAAEVVVRNDTIEYNADSYKVTEGSVLEDLLKKMPGVEVDSEGKITVNGKEIKKVMVDGKEFFSDDPKVASKNLPANMIDKLQVLDKKSDMTLMTGFDDGNEETIINLTVKPGMKQGWFGNAFAGYGSEERYEGNFMVNRFYNSDQFTIMGGVNNTNNMGFSDLASTMFQGMGGGGGPRFRGGNSSGITQSGNIGMNFSKEFNKKLTLNGNVRYSHSDNDLFGNSREEKIQANDSTQYQESESSRNRKSDNIGANLRLEWKPDTLTSIIFRPNFSYSKSKNHSSEEYVTLQGLGGMDVASMDSLNMGDSYTADNGNGYNVDARLEVSRKLNSEGRVVSGSFSGGYSDSDEDGIEYSNTYYFGSDQQNKLIDQQYQYNNKGYNYRAYVSWVEPLGRNNFLQLTYSFSQRQQEALKYTYAKDDQGLYTVLDTAYSQSYRNEFITQRASLSFKSQRQKFNYTLGLNLDPSYNKSETFIGDVVLSSISQNVVNLSPMAQFNYIHNKQTNLRVDYNGRTSQPSMTQLQPVANVSNPNNTIIGNPDLKPYYTNNLFIRFQKFLPEKQTAFMLMADGNYVVNAIVSDIRNLEGGRRETTYRNTDGNYRGNFRFMFNTPLKNKKFTINSMSMASYSNNNSFIDSQKNVNKSLTLMERGGIDFRSNVIDLGLNGNIRYNKADYSLQPKNNVSTFNYGVGGTTVLYLPYDFKIESDINWSTNSGYQAGYDQNEVIWNASASKSFLKGKQATLRFKIYDILQQRSGITQQINSEGYTYSSYNTLSSYFMVHFVYRFSIFKGGATASDAMRGRRGPGGHGGPPPMRF
ncbi:hypothetical protein M2459_002453 [Parabacteroides sp. PF5-5]|uniref:TonB-dependent receptor n=1 Tax=unclassified Parabacteroides TaxID=2649774 RepID=UPI0024754612|nr:MULTISPECIES: TonB-dependent receptor [unclassified Parabacteroides]MDH6305353.1 hypothetical protein [Parabacteroides sp. PH5-39]MDH6316706.1 hypothetical protein [Parabacteroides sp. PF5-13]MDH6320114.1 hypothetical protein [Parabacteroides sp. PH5-13]MDH6323943.1 hypothetical protein [Parabacteroides sp. PH5-8]MDH6327791.1 hypothetical protein [Parabacteroides sp. PH5-41]